MEAISVTRDGFKKQTHYKGPDISPGGALVIDKYDKVFLRAMKTDAESEIMYQIYVVDWYQGRWRYYDSTHDSNGAELPTVSISRVVESCSGSSGCTYIEHVGILVTREYLDKNRDSGIRFKVSGKAGEEVFFIPSAYVKAFLSVAK